MTDTSRLITLYVVVNPIEHNIDTSDTDDLRHCLEDALLMHLNAHAIDATVSSTEAFPSE